MFEPSAIWAGSTLACLRTAELQVAYYRAKVHVPELRVPSRLSLAFRDLNLDLARRVTYSRADIQKFWNKTWKS